MTENQVSEVKELTQEEIKGLTEKTLANPSVIAFINNSLGHYPAIKAKFTDNRELITNSLGGGFTKGQYS